MAGEHLADIAAALGMAGDQDQHHPPPLVEQPAVDGDDGLFLARMGVITSYSIHYTKLYDPHPSALLAAAPGKTDHRGSEAVDVFRVDKGPDIGPGEDLRDPSYNFV